MVYPDRVLNKRLIMQQVKKRNKGRKHLPHLHKTDSNILLAAMLITMSLAGYFTKACMDESNLLSSFLAIIGLFLHFKSAGEYI